jgi:hypothetical protein
MLNGRASKTVKSEPLRNVLHIGEGAEGNQTGICSERYIESLF